MQLHSLTFSSENMTKQETVTSQVDLGMNRDSGLFLLCHREIVNGVAHPCIAVFVTVLLYTVSCMHCMAQKWFIRRKSELHVLFSHAAAGVLQVCFTPLPCELTRHIHDVHNTHRVALARADSITQGPQCRIGQHRLG